MTGVPAFPQFEHPFPNIVEAGQLDPALTGLPAGIAQELTHYLGLWEERLEQGGASESLQDEVIQTLALYEQAHPENVTWDALRAHLAGDFLEANELSGAAGLLHGIGSRHRRAHALRILKVRREASQPTEAAVLEEAFYRHFGESQSEQLDFIRAYADILIEVDPFDPEIDRYEELLATHLPDYDPIKSWADSQTERLPEEDWEEICILVKADEMWSDTPLRYRQFVMMEYLRMHRAFLSEPSERLAEQIVAQLRAREERYLDAEIWDDRRLSLATAALATPLPALAKIFGREIKRGEWQIDVAAGLLKRGAEPAAGELVLGMQDAELMTAALLELPWPNRRGALLLSTHVNDASQPLERRLACLETMHNLFIRNSNFSAAVKCQQVIRTLKGQQ